MRFAYFDEAGIANLEQEPVVVVAGVLVDMDREWKPLKAHFEKLVERFIPELARPGFIFHAMDIWQGKGIFSRDKYTGDREEIIKALCATIHEFKLPIVFGKSAKQKVMEALPNVRDIREINRTAFMGAFAECAIDTERWMREYESHQMAAIVAENNNELRRYAKIVHTMFTGWKVFPESLFHASASHLPLVHLVDTVYFAEKREAPPLQLADLVSFLFKRYLSGAAVDERAARYLFGLAPLCPSLMRMLKQFHDRSGSDGVEDGTDSDKRK